MKITWSRTYTRLLVLLIVIAAAAGFVLFLRSPYVSNKLKMAILTEGGNAIGRQIIASNIVVNVFPAYLVADNVIAYDDNGVKLFRADSIKAYLEPEALLRKEVRLGRIVLDRPVFWGNRAQLDDVIGNLKGKVSGDGGKKKVTVGSVVINDAEIYFLDDATGMTYTARGLDAEIVVKERPEVQLSIREAAFEKADGSKVEGFLKSSLIIDKDMVRIKSLEAGALDSTISADGVFGAAKEGGLKANLGVSLRLLVTTLKTIVGLRERSDGVINASGGIKFDGSLSDAIVELKVDGDFYLEALMELLGAKLDHALKGHIFFDGNISGGISNLVASGTGVLDQALIFGVEIDTIKCDIAYGEGKLTLANGDGLLYGGKGKADVVLSMPHVKPYSVDVAFKDVNSASALALINMQALPLQPGLVTGTFRTSGNDFAPSGEVVYKSKKRGDNIMGRIEYLKGAYSMKGSDLRLEGFAARTAMSRLAFTGGVDLAAKTLDFTGSLDTPDIRDVSKPYYDRVTGGAKARAKITGTVDDPQVSAEVEGVGVALGPYGIGNVTASLSYSKNMLAVNSAEAQRDGGIYHRGNGAVAVDNAKWLFDFPDPVYEFSISADNGPLGELLSLVGLGDDVTGTFDSEVKLSGRGGDYVFSGPARFADISGYGRGIDAGGFDFIFNGTTFTATGVTLREAGTVLEGGGSITTSGRYSFKARAVNLTLKQLMPDAELGVSALMDVDASGDGTLEHPVARASVALKNIVYRNTSFEDAAVVLNVDGKNLAFEADALSGRARAKGSMLLDGSQSYKASLELDYGRYENYIRPYIDSQDMILGFDLIADISGGNGSNQASLLINRLNVNMFGQGYVNSDSIKLRVVDDNVMIDSLEMRSGAAEFGASGKLRVGSAVDLELHGSSYLAILRAFVPQIDQIKGQAKFALDMTGEWDSPQVNGSLSVENGAVSIKGMHYRFADIGGKLIFQGDRVYVEGVKASLGGGTVSAEGVVAFEGYSPEEIKIEAKLKDVTLSLTRKFIVNVGGDIFLTGNAEHQDITGDIWINRASYKQRIEWKSWLLSRTEKLERSGESWRDRVSLNVKMFGQERLEVDNNLARAKINMNMVVRGSLGRPQLFGRVGAVEGVVFFRNSRFNIVRATADYMESDAPGPYVDILAETSVKGYNITLRLEGRTDQLELTLNSNPPLDEVDVIALLTLGEAGEGLDGIESGIGAAEATSFLTGKFQDLMEERVSDIIGFDRFQIDPYVSKETGSVSPRVKVSKSLVEDKLYVTYASSIGAETEQEMLVEYLLGPNVSLVGGQDDTGSIGGDIKFRFRFE